MVTRSPMATIRSELRPFLVPGNVPPQLIFLPPGEVRGPCLPPLGTFALLSDNGFASPETLSALLWSSGPPGRDPYFAFSLLTSLWLSGWLFSPPNDDQYCSDVLKSDPPSLSFHGHDCHADIRRPIQVPLLLCRLR